MFEQDGRARRERHGEGGGIERPRLCRRLAAHAGGDHSRRRGRRGDRHAAQQTALPRGRATGSGHGRLGVRPVGRGGTRGTRQTEEEDGGDERARALAAEGRREATGVPAGFTRPQRGVGAGGGNSDVPRGGKADGGATTTLLNEPAPSPPWAIRYRRNRRYGCSLHTAARVDRGSARPRPPPSLLSPHRPVPPLLSLHRSVPPPPPRTTATGPS